MLYRSKLVLVGLLVTVMTFYILISSNSLFEYPSVYPLTLLRSGKFPPPYRKGSPSGSTERGSTVDGSAANETTGKKIYLDDLTYKGHDRTTESTSTSDKENRNGEYTYFGQRIPMHKHTRTTQSTSPSIAETQDGVHTSVGLRIPIQKHTRTTQSTSPSVAENQDGAHTSVGLRTSPQTNSRTMKSSSMTTSEYLSSNQADENVTKRSPECDKPSGDTGFDELLRRYRHCMGKLVSHALDNATLQSVDNTSPMELQKQREEFGMLNSSRWWEMAGRLATVKKGCRVPAVEFTGAPSLSNVVFDKTHHLAYCRHGKAGTTSLLSFLLSLNHVDPATLSAYQIHKRIYEYLPKPTKESQKDLMKKSFTFTAVRHPFRRLVSAYCNKEVENSYKILSKKIRDMSSVEREEELLEYNYKVQLGTREPVLIAGPWIRRAIPNRHMTEGVPEDGSLLAHYLSAADFNSSQKDTLIEPTIGIHFKGVPSEADQTDSHLSSAESFREFVHGVVLELLNCGSGPNCLSDVDLHVRPQVIRWNPCVLHFDMIMKVETLDQDIELMKDLLALPEPVAEDQTVRNEGSLDHREDEVGDQTDRLKKIPDIEADEGEDETVIIEGNPKDLNPKGMKNLRRKRAVNQNDNVRAAKNAGEESETHQEIEHYLTIDNRREKSLVSGDGKMERFSGEKAMEVSSEDSSEDYRDNGFFKRNTSGRKCASYEENMKQLSQRDIDLIYTSYYLDFKLFGYEPFD